MPPPPSENKLNPDRAPELPDWDDVRVLLSVVETGSFNRTAKLLGITQPTVSRRIAKLEDVVGAKLVERGSNGATLTLEGQKVLENLQVARGAIDRAFNRAMAAPPRGEPATILTTDGIVAHWLPHFLPFLLEHHPELDLRAITASDTNVLERQFYDVSVHHVQPSDPNLIAMRLGTLHFMPFAAHGYIARHGRPLAAADLAQHCLLDCSIYLIDNGNGMTRLSATTGEPRPRFFTNSNSALAECVRRGAGIALLPTYGLVFERSLEALDLNLRFSTPFWLSYHRSSLEKPAVRIAIQFLKHVFNRRAMPWFADEFVPPQNFPPIAPDEVMAGYSATSATAAPAAAG